MENQPDDESANNYQNYIKKMENLVSHLKTHSETEEEKNKEYAAQVLKRSQKLIEEQQRIMEELNHQDTENNLDNKKEIIQTRIKCPECGSYIPANFISQAQNDIDVYCETCGILITNEIIKKAKVKPL